MPDGGTLTVSTANLRTDLFSTDPHEGHSFKNFVQITISDTGSGIPRELVDKIFEPFFTTKSKGKGTGLGLAMVYGFVSRANGEIRVYSEEGLGTTFRIYLPRSEVEIAELSINEETMAVGGDEIILVVDDEDQLIEVAKANLEDAGYRVLTASNGEEALEALADRHDIDLILSDVIMPGGINGFELALKAAHLRPPTKCTLTSGFTGHAGHSLVEGNLFARYLAQTLLPKPYGRTELLCHVRSILDQEHFLEWSEDLSVGVEAIDDDHRILITLLNRLYAASQKADEGKMTSEVLVDLAAYVVRHFRREETVMDACCGTVFPTTAIRFPS